MQAETGSMDVEVVILGTGLREAILAAALSKAGFTVAHLDYNEYYGGDDASLSLDELRKWARERSEPPHTSNYLSSQRARFTAVSSSWEAVHAQARHFSISLSPTTLPSVGPLIDSLMASGSSRYGGFKLLERVALYDKPGYVKMVPGSKEDVFKSSELGLLDKRRLMRFLMFATSEFEDKPELVGHEDTPFVDFLRQTFSLNEGASIAVAYALAFNTTTSDTTLPALQRIRRYLRSAGRYGPSPFLVGHYGGAGEVAQGFCRLSAVHGGIYILGREVTSITTSEIPAPPSSTASPRTRYTLALQDFPEQLSCDVLISTHDYLDPSLKSQATRISSDRPSQAIARCIAVIDKPIVFRSSQFSNSQGASEDETDGSTQVDTALLIFPPSCLEAGSSTAAANVLISGPQAYAAPEGHFLLHLSMPLVEPTSRTAEELLKPYLDATLSMADAGRETSASESQPIRPSHTLFYVQHLPTPPSPSDASQSLGSLFVPPSDETMLSELSDSAATNAETTFWKVVEKLKEIRRIKRESAETEGDKSVEEPVVDSFWPPISDTTVVDQDW
ncbi:Rab proteins geranylgeranyltransferase component A [Steccherinum ochraceum]|uniref:Rab proteins geranylgeranyltransferase component A n=1 Tax=Steccherinum ochraceum TaxID=92696 RepID=A0A4R0RPS9_9APHY|nr:Rab proteins geranylgeranyltransferase component A [Steccherinum ochraceum]